MSSKTRVGIVGAGRTRNGLGPFLAAACERAGMRVTGVSGRDRESAGRAAAGLEDRLGHRPAAFATALELAGAVDLLVVSSPAAAHVDGLEAALAAGVACLCEKPLVLPEQTERGLALVAAFRARDLPLVENCQWPHALPTMFALHPELDGALVSTVEMGLCPAAGGRAMVLDSLSHVLSVAQAVAEVDPAGAVSGVQQDDPGGSAERNVVRFALPIAGGDRGRGVSVTLRLERRDTQPRPAWIAIDGRRVDRRIGAGYSQFLCTPDGREQRMPDPLDALVYGLPGLLAPSARDDTLDALARTITTRLRCFRGVVDGLG